MSDNRTYIGPGANILPAVKYLRSKGATSEASAISLDEIPSEDFRQLLKLNGQTSMWIGITPDGKYWVRSNGMFIVIGIVIIVFIAILFLMFNMYQSFSTRYNNVDSDIQNKIEEMKESIQD